MDISGSGTGLKTAQTVIDGVQKLTSDSVDGYDKVAAGIETGAKLTVDALTDGAAREIPVVGSAIDWAIGALAKNWYMLLIPLIIVGILVFSLVFGLNIPSLLTTPPSWYSSFGAGVGANPEYPPVGMKLYTPAQIAYSPMNVPAIEAWLAARGSQESDPGLLTELDAVAKRWNVSPLLLLAITGAEQSFVPAGDNPAELSNPWNVTGGSGPGSWVTFSPGWETAASIAAATVYYHSQNMPPNFPGGIIAWITSPENPEGVYASDYSTWELNVSKFYSELLAANK